MTSEPTSWTYFPSATLWCPRPHTFWVVITAAGLTNINRETQPRVYIQFRTFSTSKCPLKPLGDCDTAF